MNEKSPIQIPDAGTVANLAAVFAAAPVGVMFVDGGGAIVAANPAATRILGRSTAELQGLTPADPTWAASDLAIKLTGAHTLSMADISFG